MKRFEGQRTFGVLCLKHMNNGGVASERHLSEQRFNNWRFFLYLHPHPFLTGSASDVLHFHGDDKGKKAVMQVSRTGEAFKPCDNIPVTK